MNEDKTVPMMIAHLTGGTYNGKSLEAPKDANCLQCGVTPFGDVLLFNVETYLRVTWARADCAEFMAEWRARCN